jgi:acyl dehydratase
MVNRWGEIDEAGIAEARALIGVPLRRERMRWLERASADAIRHFALGIGDDNPLWLDHDHARVTRYAGVIAPPTFLYAVDSTIVAPKLPGVQWIYAGTSWTWFDVVCLHDLIDSEVRLTAVEEKVGRRYGRWVLERGLVTYRRRGGEIVAIAEGRTARTPRTSSGERSADPDTAPESEAATAPASARRKGHERRSWGQVKIGDVVGPLSKGPLDLRQVLGWYVAAQGALHYGGAHGDGVRYRRRHADYAINPDTGAKEFAAAGHFDARTGRDIGMGGAYDVGPQRISWAAQMLTDWAGDEGFVHKLTVDLRRPNRFGDVTTWRGDVVERFKDPALGAGVEIAIDAHNQRGELTAAGEATVLLPTGNRAVRLPIEADDPAARSG